MKKLAVLLFCIVMLRCAPVRAQDAAPPAQNPPSAPAPTPAPAAPAEAPAAPAPAISTRFNPRIPARFEISFGYSYRAYSPTISTTLKTNGVYASFEYNVFSWIGVYGDAAATGRTQGVQSEGTAQSLGILTALGGIQAYPLRHHKVTLFMHALGGEGYYGLRAPAYGGFASKTVTSNGFAYEVGAGLDIRIKQHWAIRAAEGDYGATSFFGGNPHQGGYRVATGLVYLIGEK